MASLSPKVARRRGSMRRRAPSHLPPYTVQDAHNAALHAIRSFLKGHTSYDAFPVSYRLIVLDTKLSVKKALQCLLLNGRVTPPLSAAKRISNAHFQVSYPRPCGTVKGPSLPAC